MFRHASKATKYARQQQLCIPGDRYMEAPWTVNPTMTFLVSEKKLAMNVGVSVFSQIDHVPPHPFSLASSSTSQIRKYLEKKKTRKFRENSQYKQRRTFGRETKKKGGGTRRKHRGGARRSRVTSNCRAQQFPLHRNKRQSLINTKTRPFNATAQYLE